MREDIRNIYSLNAIHRSSVEDQNDEAAGNNLVSSWGFWSLSFVALRVSGRVRKRATCGGFLYYQRRIKMLQLILSAVFEFMWALGSGEVNCILCRVAKLQVFTFTEKNGIAPFISRHEQRK